MGYGERGKKEEERGMGRSESVPMARDGEAGSNAQVTFSGCTFWAAWARVRDYPHPLHIDCP